MAKVKMYPDEFVNGCVAHHVEVQARIRSEADQIGSRAKANKAGHRKAGHLEVEVEHHFTGKYGNVDSRISLHDPTAPGNSVAVSAIEYGHDPGGWYARQENARPVEGLYILTKAAGLA